MRAFVGMLSAGVTLDRLKVPAKVRRSELRAQAVRQLAHKLPATAELDLLRAAVGSPCFATSKSLSHTPSMNLKMRP